MSDPRMRGFEVAGNWYIPSVGEDLERLERRVPLSFGGNVWGVKVPGPAPARFEYTGEYRLPKQDDYWLSPRTHQMRMDIAYLNEYFDGGKRWILRKVEECGTQAGHTLTKEFAASIEQARTDCAGGKGMVFELPLPSAEEARKIILAPEPLKVGDRVRCVRI